MWDFHVQFFEVVYHDHFLEPKTPLWSLQMGCFGTKAKFLFLRSSIAMCQISHVWQACKLLEENQLWPGALGTHHSLGTKSGWWRWKWCTSTSCTWGVEIGWVWNGGGRPEKDLVWVGSYKNAYAGDMLLLILDPSWICVVCPGKLVRTHQFEWDAQNFIVFSWCLWAHEPTDRGSQKVGLSRSTRNYLTKDSTIVKPFVQKELSRFHATLQMVCLKETLLDSI